MRRLASVVAGCVCQDLVVYSAGLIMRMAWLKMQKE